MEIIGQYVPWEPPHEINNFGSQFWYKQYSVALHREDGPAVIFKNGHTEWYKEGSLHREDGPAIIRTNGDKYWYIHNEDITFEVIQWAEHCNIDLDNMSESEKLLLKIFINGL